MHLLLASYVRFGAPDLLLPPLLFLCAFFVFLLFLYFLHRMPDIQYLFADTGSLRPLFVLSGFRGNQVGRCRGRSTDSALSETKKIKLYFQSLKKIN